MPSVRRLRSNTLMSIEQDPYDEGVQNWLRLVLSSREKENTIWGGMMILPQYRACAEDYITNRYLEVLPTELLITRYRDLYGCTLGLDDDGYIAFLPFDHWHVRWIHTATELVIRGESLEGEKFRPPMSHVRSEPVLKAIKAKAHRKLEWGHPMIVKYGDAKFLSSALQKGAFRVSPASYYNDPSLNLARRDTELERNVMRDGFSSNGVLNAVGKYLSAEEFAHYTSPVESRTDYYILCFALGYEPRLFYDFQANSCLVITEIGRFLDALEAAAINALPGWEFGSAPIRYIDPFQHVIQGNSGEPDPRYFAPFLCKDFKYSYQREFRAGWLPPEPMMNLDHIFIELGPLTDYCELIML